MNAQKRQVGRSRPEAQVTSPQDLRELARLLIDASGKLEEAADQLETEAKGASVKINYTGSVLEGINYAHLMANDVDRKIMQRKFVYPDAGVDLPQTEQRLPAPKPTKRQDSPRKK